MHIKLPIGLNSRDFVHRMIRAHILTDYFIISHSAFNFSAASHAYSADVVPSSEPCQIITPLVLVGVRVRCGGGVRIRGGVSIRQSDSDFNERGNNLAGGRKWAQHRCPDILSYPSDFPTGAYCACAHQYFVLFLMLNNNI